MKSVYKTINEFNEKSFRDRGADTKSKLSVLEQLALRDYFMNYINVRDQTFGLKHYTCLCISLAAMCRGQDIRFDSLI